MSIGFWAVRLLECSLYAFPVIIRYEYLQGDHTFSLHGEAEMDFNTHT